MVIFQSYFGLPEGIIGFQHRHPHTSKVSEASAEHEADRVDTQSPCASHPTPVPTEFN